MTEDLGSNGNGNIGDPKAMPGLILIGLDETHAFAIFKSMIHSWRIRVLGAAMSDEYVAFEVPSNEEEVRHNRDSLEFIMMSAEVQFMIPADGLNLDADSIEELVAPSTYNPEIDPNEDVMKWLKLS